MEDEAGVRARGVTRAFGSIQALRGIDLTVPYGQVTVLVGPNGVGKTTLLLILAGLLAPDAGEIRVAGHDLRAEPEKARAALGWMPDMFGAYDQLTVAEYLEFFANAHGLPASEVVGRVVELLEWADLLEMARRPLHVLSRGQKQRLGLARTLVHRPKVLLLDEPASGLDPASRRRLHDLLRSLAAEGAAVLISSHALSELEEIADRAVLLDEGGTVGEHGIAALTAETRGLWRVRALEEEPLIAALNARKVPCRVLPGSSGLDVGPLSELEAAVLLAELVGEGVRISSYTPVVGALESAYLAMTEGRT